MQTMQKGPVHHLWGVSTHTHSEGHLQYTSLFQPRNQQQSLRWCSLCTQRLILCPTLTLEKPLRTSGSV